MLPPRPVAILNPKIPLPRLLSTSPGSKIMKPSLIVISEQTNGADLLLKDHGSLINDALFFWQVTIVNNKIVIFL